MTFRTKFFKNQDRNGQRCDIVKIHHTKSGERYDIKFEDGAIIKNVYTVTVNTLLLQQHMRYLLNWGSLLFRTKKVKITS